MTRSKKRGRKIYRRGRTVMVILLCFGWREYRHSFVRVHRRIMYNRRRSPRREGYSRSAVGECATLEAKNRRKREKEYCLLLTRVLTNVNDSFDAIHTRTHFSTTSPVSSSIKIYLIYVDRLMRGKIEKCTNKKRNETNHASEDNECYESRILSSE